MIENKYDVLLFNIYGPNRDDPDFYKIIDGIINNFQGDFIILGGDFNLIQDDKLDLSNYKTINNPKSRDAVLQLKEKFNLNDPWRIQHDTLNQYTWFCHNPVKKARLDVFLISNELMTLVEKTAMKSGYRTDHSFVELNISFSDFQKGKGFWKFNNSLLKDTTYVQEVKSIISKLKQEYAAAPYHRAEIDNIDNEDLTLCTDDQTFFELLLLKIRGFTISYSARRKRIKNERLKYLEKRIKELEHENSINSTQQSTENLRILKDEEEDIRREYIKGLFIRSRAKWIEEGEKPTKYFLNMEKRNYINKTVTRIADKNRKQITNQNDILAEIENFYRALYSNQVDKLENVDLRNIVDIEQVNTLSEDMAQQLEGKLTYQEALQALKHMKNDKTPGTDGYTTEFFKFFWKDVGIFLLRPVNYSFDKGELSITQKQGIISILPKGDKPREFLKKLATHLTS